IDTAELERMLPGVPAVLVLGAPDRTKIVDRFAPAAIPEDPVDAQCGEPAATVISFCLPGRDTHLPPAIQPRDFVQVVAEPRFRAPFCSAGDERSLPPFRNA